MTQDQSGKNLTVGIASQLPPELGLRIKGLNGTRRAAILMLNLGKDNAAPIWSNLAEEEVRLLAQAMVELETIDPETVSALLFDFILRLSDKNSVKGSVESTELLLASYLPKENVNSIMEDIRGPAGRDIWEKLSNVQEHLLANYLKGEHPQTASLILSKITPTQTAKILKCLPDQFAMDIIYRMLNMEPVRKEIVRNIEKTLHSEFIATLTQTQGPNAYEEMSEVFNCFDRQTEIRFMNSLEKADSQAAEKIKSLMFTFDDLSNLENSAIQTLLRSIDKNALAIALKGASEEARQLFFSNLSERAAQMTKEDMEAMGPVRLRDVDEAQSTLVNTAKDLAAKGEIVIAKDSTDDEYIS